MPQVAAREFPDFLRSIPRIEAQCGDVRRFLANFVAVGNFGDIRAIASVSDKIRTQRSMVADPMGAAWWSPALAVVQIRCN